MDSWIDTALKLGVTGLVLLGAGYAWVKQIWPLITERLKKADEERAEFSRRYEEQGKLFTDSLKQERDENARRFDDQGKLFTEALRTQNVFAAESHKEITQELRAIHERLRNGR